MCGPLTYLQGNCSDCKLIASKQKSVLLLFTLTWSPRLVYSSRMANLIERQRQKSDTQKFLSWRWYTIGLNLYEVACQMLGLFFNVDIIVLISCILCFSKCNTYSITGNIMKKDYKEISTYFLWKSLTEKINCFLTCRFGLTK